MVLSATGSGRRWLGLASALVLGVIPPLLGVVASGCDPGHDVTYDNRTNERLSVYEFGRYDFTLEPLQKASYGVFEFAGSMPIEARDDSGSVVYSDAFTWEQLEQMNWEIVITDTSELPQPGPTASALPP